MGRGGWVFGALAWALVASPSLAADRPNVVLIVADDLGYGDLGCYGQKTIPTPKLDRLAREGTRFAQAYAGSTVCAPSRCALMTGKHTGHCRVRGNALVPLQPEDVTIADVLKSAGYATALIGKWGLGEPGTPGLPNRQGFDLFFGYLNQHHAHNYWPDHLWKDETKHSLDGNKIGPVDNVSVERAQYAPDLFVRQALDYLEANKDRPFFLELATILPHANNERGRAEGNGMEVPELGSFADKDWPAPQKGHAAMIARLDTHVGEVLDKLKKLGLEEKTLVIFTSDNGPHKEGGADPAFFRSSGGLRGYKRALYEGGIRVPILVRWPGHVPEGTTSDQVWAFWDLLPTLAELVDAKAPADLDGVSVFPVLLGKGQTEHPPLYWEFHEGGFTQAVRMGDWKAVRPKMGGPIELYDLKTDPAESRDVADDHHDVIARFETFLKTARTESADFPVRPGR
jgi:arylsulfatase A-like enzyme